MTQPTETRTTTFSDDDVVVSRLHADGVLTATCTRPDGFACMTVYVPHGYPLEDALTAHGPGVPVVCLYPVADLDADMADSFQYAVMYDVTDAAREAAATRKAVA